MHQRIAALTLLVKDYDKAIAFYTQQLGFQLLEDTDLGNGKRGVGNQAGGRILLFLYTDNFQRDYTQFRERGVRFLEEPRHESYGTVAVFEDCYGNKWDLLEQRITA
jgi:catechol 2,3-dioxygenase-like lactoylglutathione lyase family enzyme